ncbi:MAG: cupin domain-containing protein [Nakamurella sp.]
MSGTDDAATGDAVAAGEALAAALDLELLPLEGGLFRRTFTGAGATAILFMLIGADFSAMHRLGSDELYFHHAGSPLRMLLIHPDGGHREVLIGSAGVTDQLPQFLVPANHWQGSSVEGGWSLVSTVVTPGFDWHDFVLGERDALTALSPDAAARIAELTRRQPPL